MIVRLIQPKFGLAVTLIRFNCIVSLIIRGMWLILIARDNELAIYTIGLNVASNSSAEKLLRYIAWVGDDPLRESADPCRFTPGNQACGQYYFATQNDLSSIFDDIASRIYTKISE